VTSAKGDDVPLKKLVLYSVIPRPPEVYRADLYPAVRITGAPPKGKTTAAAAKTCVELFRSWILSGRPPMSTCKPAWSNSAGNCWSVASISSSALPTPIVSKSSLNFFFQAVTLLPVPLISR